MVSEVLEPAGLRLKGDDGEPQDLRDPEYNRVFLGLIPRWKNGLLTFSIPELAFETLTIGLQVANETPNPAENAFQRCVGWLQQLRPALMRSVERQVVDRVVSIARHSGFRNVNHRDMLKTTASAESVAPGTGEKPLMSTHSTTFTSVVRTTGYLVYFSSDVLPHIKQAVVSCEGARDLTPRLIQYLWCDPSETGICL
ncbi:MAG: hypothetical protein R3C49_26250 [Planctomycetaceae bacterium]